MGESENFNLTFHQQLINDAFDFNKF
jgi:hypothetical protein